MKRVPTTVRPKCIVFYGGPIDEDYSGVEGYLNAWPLDESYIDYVVGYPEAGIINRPEEFPVINLTLLLARNGVGGEGNISTGLARR